jgi:flagellar FliL protein
MTGNRMLDNILLGSMLLASLAAFSILFYSLNIFEKTLPVDSVERAALLADSKQKTFSEAYKLDKLIVNLKSRTSRLRFLDLETYLVPFKSQHHDTLEENKAVINDIIIDEAARMQPEELNTVSGKLIFENRLRTRINEALRGSLVKDIFFSRFVVQ